MEGENILKYAMSFLLGAVAGAAFALLYTPSTGDELRANIKTQADTQYAKLQDEYQKGLQELHAKMDKISSELQSMSSRSK